MDFEVILQEIGFSRSEAKVYLCLQKLGGTKAGRIIKQAGLQSSVVHNALNTLQEKGFITSVLIGKIKHYHALKPSLVKDYIESKKKEFERIIPMIEDMTGSEKEVPTAEVFTGMKGLIAATHKLIEGDKKGVFMYFAIEGSRSSGKALEFFEKLDIIKKEKGIRVKGIASKNNKLLKYYEASEIRFTSQEIPPAMNIYGNKILIYSFEGKPTGILIESGEIAAQYRKLWQATWNNSNKKKV